MMYNFFLLIKQNLHTIRIQNIDKKDKESDVL